MTMRGGRFGFGPITAGVGNDPYHDRDLLAAFGAQPDDKPTEWATAPRGDRFVAAANVIGQWGVWDTQDRKWATFPQDSWGGDEGREMARDEAAGESECDRD